MKPEEDITANESWSDSEDGDGGEHERFLAALAKLDNRKFIRPSTRKEPSLQVSEFHLSKEDDGQQDKVQLWQLAKTVSQRPSHKHVARKLKSIQRKSLTLPKPLEKPEASRVQREVGYEDVKTQLESWDPIVFSNRAADHLVFPLSSSNKEFGVSSEDFLSDKQKATDLEKQIDEILHKDEPQKEEKEEEFTLSLQEMMERRKELARLRVRESYRHAKAHYQNKIKSKKYHRLAKKERIRNELKEFESLQIKDPEAALQKLEELEKERALERASLRHRSTGKWAKNQAVRAKYDRESRQVLGEQLKISKALTQKVKSDSENSEEEDETVQVDEPSDNPWVSNNKKSASEVDQFLSGYRKFWDNKLNLENNGPGETSLSNSPDNVSQNNHSFETKSSKTLDPLEEAALKNAVVSYSEVYPESKNTIQCSKISSFPKVGQKIPKASLKSQKKNHAQVAHSKFVKSASGNWSVTTLENPKAFDRTDIQDLFDTLNEKMKKKAERKVIKLKEDMEEKESKSYQNSVLKSQPASKDENLLEMKKQRMQIDIDEALHEGIQGENPQKISLSVPKYTRVEKPKKELSSAAQLDPNKFISSKPVQLQNMLPDDIAEGDEGLDDSDADNDVESKLLTISEAFADDDVVAEFSKEKEDAVNKDKPSDIDLSLPGWGEWGGHLVKPNKRKRKRFMVKIPDAPPRKDANKGNLIINENEDSSARDHQVQSLPYPFTRVRDFEASIRAPISGTFIPQSAHRKLIKPAVRTKMGAVITPMDKSAVLNKRKYSQTDKNHISLNPNSKKKVKHH